MGKLSIVAVLRLLAVIGQIAYIKLYTHYLSPVELGIFFFYTTISYFLNALLLVPVDFFQQAEIFHRIRRGESIRSIFSLNAAMLGWIGGITLLAEIPVLLWKPSFALALIVISATAVCLYISTAIKNFLNNQGDQSFVVWMLILEIPLKVAAFWELVRLQRAGPVALMSSTSLALLIVFIFCGQRALRYKHLFHGIAVPVSFRQVTRFCSPISAGALLNWLQLQGYRLVLVPLGFAADVGIFATVYGIGYTGMQTAAIVYRQVYEPRIYQSYGKYLKTYLKGGLGLIAFVLFCGLVLRAQLIALTTNKTFTHFASVIAYGVLANAGNFLIGALVIRLSIDDNTILQIKAHAYGLAAVPPLYFLLYFLHELNVFTLGLPIVLSQAIVVAYLYFSVEAVYAKQHAESNA